MSKNKIAELTRLPILVEKHKQKHQKVGLITGCFDILHIGHLELFEQAKKYVDILIIGLENDETITKSKGQNRPVNNQDTRLRFLSSIDCVDYVFLIKDDFDYSDDVKASEIHSKVLNTVKPTYLLTNKKTDKYWKNKDKRLHNTDVKLLDIKIDRPISSSEIVNHLISEL